MLPFTPAVPIDYYRRPDFLVISPPKTGSTWLADNLRCHPELYVPPIKEVKYFSSLFRWLDFGWYCDHFTPAGDRRAGEASPSYAALSAATIRRVRQLLPDVKLVFLMRDPVSRAWSHAKHNRLYGEANFCPTATAPPTSGDDQWRANFVHDWPLVSGDYLGQLRRWTDVFPAEQMYVGFYECIASRPTELLRDVFRFLGVDPSVNLSGFPVTERVLAGPTDELPDHLARDLRGLLRGRTEELADFLRSRFGLGVPPEWRTTLDGPVSAIEEPPAFRSGGDDYPSAVMRQEESFAWAYRDVLAYYRGYAIVFYRGALYAVPAARGAASPELLAELTRSGTAPGDCPTAATVPELKERIANELLAAASARVRAVEEELRKTRVETTQLRADVSQLLATAERPSLARRALRAVRRRARTARALFN